ncbi:hypothetical protein [Streptomyces sp. 4N124]|uniref:hypothetical protein n=1 Tax=Streptomyces sp. 4N124 TaxID=3457420 RepID=UPI003FD100E9
MIRIAWSAVGDNTMIVTRGDQDHFLFLVIPPGTGIGPAHAAMITAVQDDNAAWPSGFWPPPASPGPTGATYRRVHPAEPG